MTNPRRRLPFVRYSQRRRYIYACASHAEWDVVKTFADREGLTMSDFVRRCVNAYLTEADDDVLLLAEYNRATDDDP
jgi:hypothetical protein